ncbi:MAG: tRNA 2-selenouridine(34) synthase MnmH [Bacteroidetes bacterium]|nr:tRNA 2-selenouridine(34) synthase MnmH [Bacteroidota bacterium]
MPITKLNIDEFIQRANSLILLDVRSPGEYEHAHIPGAYSLPLFTNEERKVVGTAYKQESREKAIKIGLDYFGSKTVKLIEEVEKLIAEKKVGKEVGVHCWRGGMRSAAIAWLLDLYGFKVYLLAGGYKAYRNYAIQQFFKAYELRIVGGYTGSNKTGVLSELKKRNEKIIDLENLALHKGSAFGNLDLHAQPSQEMFENLLAAELEKHNADNTNTIIWLEDESQRLGNVNVPLPFFQSMRSCPVLFLNIPFEERLKHIMVDYGKYSKEKIINAIVRIKKKLGGLETKNAVNFILEDDLINCFSVLLKYYDRLYLKNTYKREEAEKKITLLDLISVDAKINSEKLIQHVYNKQYV